ncbi:MAG: zf-HC2 domain-containing protein [Terracidiphilus sp.]
MRIECKHVWQYISAYIDGEVDADLRAEIDKHLETCEICSAVLDSTRNVVVLYADDRVFELPTGFSERLHERLEKKWKCPDREPAGDITSNECQRWRLRGTLGVKSGPMSLEEVEDPRCADVWEYCSVFSRCVAVS